VHTNLGGCNEQLLRIQELIGGCGDEVALAILNGSLATNDSKAGWSDVDLFCVIRADTLASPDRLRKVGACLSAVDAAMYAYNIYQLHGTFVSTEVDLQFYSQSTLPIACLNNGARIGHGGAPVQLRCADDTIDVAAFFLNDIVRSSRRLIRKRRLSTLEQVLLFHRVYAFPFAFWQCENEPVYKRESFELVTRHYSDVFPGIGEFYEEVNAFYEGWHVERLRTYTVRKHLVRKFDPSRVNRAFLPLETEGGARIRNGFRALRPQLETFASFLETAEQRVLDLITGARTTPRPRGCSSLGVRQDR
jgi:hypothetical protein